MNLAVKRLQADKARMNQTGNSFHARGMVNDVYAKADLSTCHKTTFSLAAIYGGIGVGVAITLPGAR